MRKLGIGVLGVGEMGKRHAENIRRLVPEARLAAVADVAAERAGEVAAELEIEHSFRSFDAMLECKDVDAVLIATPDKFHARAIREAAAAGKDILCEKPLATNLADAHEALNAVAKALVFPDYFGHNWDAFYDCLVDLEHDKGEGLLVVLRDTSGFARAEPDEFAAAVDALQDAADFWEDEQKTLLVVVELEAAVLAPELPEVSG